MRTALNYVIDGLPSLWNALDRTPDVKLKNYKKFKPLNEAQIVSKVKTGIRANWVEIGDLMKVEFKKVKQLDK